MGNFMSILPGTAVLSFTAMVVLTMLAAMTFDPRLLWDKDEARSVSFSERRRRVSGPIKQVENMRQVRFNSIWLVPLIALLVAAWMLYQNWSTQGPVITLIASNAEGLEMGKTETEIP